MNVYFYFPTGFFLTFRYNVGMEQVSLHGPPTFSVVLSGCQVDGQVDDDEQSPQLRHVGYPHTLIDSHKWTSQRWVKMLWLLCFGISHALLSFTVFIFLSSPPSWHPPSSPSLSCSFLFFFFLCVCVLCSGLAVWALIWKSSGFWVAPALLAGLVSQLLADWFSYWATLQLTG